MTEVIVASVNLVEGRRPWWPAAVAMAWRDRALLASDPGRMVIGTTSDAENRIPGPGLQPASVAASSR